MYLTAEQRDIGTLNFLHALGTLERDFLEKSLSAPNTGRHFFGYGSVNGKPVRCGIVGVGNEGREALIAQSSPEYIDFVGYHDIRPSNASGITKTFETLYGPEKAKKVKRFDKWEDMLADESIEAIMIATPLWTHARFAIEAMKAGKEGKHVLCEKLMAHSVTEAKEMVRVAEARKRILSIGHQRHYSPLYKLALSVVQSGVLGEIRHIRALWHRNNTWLRHNPETGEPTGVINDSWKPDIPEADQSADWKAAGYKSLEELIRWRLFDRTGGGLMAELGSHQLDACSIFLNKVHPLEVQATGGKHFFHDERECEDHVYCMYRMPGDTTLSYTTINSNTLFGYGEIVTGTKGTFAILNERDVMLFKEREPGDKWPAQDMRARFRLKPGTLEPKPDFSGKPELAYYPNMDVSSAAALARTAIEKHVWFKPVGKSSAMVDRGYRGEMEAFASAIRNPGEKVRCDGKVALADTVMALAANVAMRSGGKLKFDSAWYDPASPAAPDSRPSGPVAAS
jgi:predicted dehydrogenase